MIEWVKWLARFSSCLVSLPFRVKAVEDDVAAIKQGVAEDRFENIQRRRALYDRLGDMEKNINARIDGWAQSITARIDNAILNKSEPTGGD